jgi:tRNA G18 (ribose-2'-O)-methylase SpoU
MPIQSFEIRICQSCGLRYPLAEGHSFGLRCPHCLGETHTVVKKKIERESTLKDPPKSGNIKSVLLDNIRSAWNVGSILRTADGFGFAHAYLCGITPTPENKDVQKTALGADEFVTWSHHMDAVKLVKGLKKEGWKVWALEEDERAEPVSRIGNPTCNTVLIVGSEVTGVDPALVELADNIFYIPMHGQKRSFNVAVAFGIAAWALKVES